MIFEAARPAPSAGNRQPWHFVVVRDTDRKKALAEAANNQSFLSEAAAIVAAVGVVALLPIGIPNETPAPKPRKQLSEIFFKEEWQTPWQVH